MTWTTVVVAAALWACSHDAATRPNPPDETTNDAWVSRAGIPVAEPQMRGALAKVTREVAVALADPTVRATVYKELHASPYREHKLHLATILRGDAASLLSAMGAARRATPDGAALAPTVEAATTAVLATLDSIIDLEFYMPVPEHWAAWNGDSRLIVAGALDDQDEPIGFDLAGKPVRLSAAHPPDVPTLVVVRDETDFSSPSALRSPPPPARVTTVDPPGVYMTSSWIPDAGQYEGWTAGQPEFEVHAFVQNSVGTFIDLQCAGHDQSNPLYYDQNGDDWSGRVLVILEEGIGLHQVEFQVWEDDYQACAWNAGRPPHTTDHTANDIKNLAAKIFQAYIDTGVKQIASILMVVPGLLDLGFALNHDDPVGVVSLTGPETGCWPATGPAAFDIKRPSDGARVGTVDLDVTFGHRVPLCPFSVAIGGSGAPTEYTDETWVAGGIYGTTPYTFNWYVDGQFVGTGTSYRQHVNATSFEIRLDGTDAVGATASYTLSVDPQPACVPNPPDVECPVMSKRRTP